MWLWVITIFSTFSTLHLVAHSLWAQAATAAGAVQLAVVRGRLHSSYWSLVTSGALVVTGAAFLVHEQNGWLFARSAFLHHLIGWTLSSRPCSRSARRSGLDERPGRGGLRRRGSRSP